MRSRPQIKQYRSRVRIRYLEADQLRLYMAALRRPFRPLFQLLVGTGLRLGEAEALRVCNLRSDRVLIEDAKALRRERRAPRPVHRQGYRLETSYY